MLRSLCNIEERKSRESRESAGAERRSFPVEQRGFQVKRKQCTEEKEPEKKSYKDCVGFWFKTNAASRKKRRRIQLEIEQRNSKQKRSAKRPGKRERLLQKALKESIKEGSVEITDLCPEEEVNLIGGTYIGKRVRAKGNLKREEGKSWCWCWLFKNLGVQSIGVLHLW